MSRLRVVKKVHRITLKTLNRVKHLKIHCQIKFHHILCNSSTDMASLELWSSLLQVLLYFRYQIFNSLLSHLYFFVHFFFPFLDTCTVPWNKGRVEKKTTPYWRLSDVSRAYQKHIRLKKKKIVRPVFLVILIKKLWCQITVKREIKEYFYIAQWIGNFSLMIFDILQLKF